MHWGHMELFIKGQGPSFEKLGTGSQKARALLREACNGFCSPCAFCWRLLGKSVLNSQSGADIRRSRLKPSSGEAEFQTGGATSREASQAAKLTLGGGGKGVCS